MTPRVSILLTCYNHLDYLKLAAETIRSQTFTDYEILALDDGSTDGTREWLAEQTNWRIFCHDKNLGTYGNLNFGIEQSLGEFLAVFNDDDLWAPEKLSKQVEAFDADARVGLVHCGGWFIGSRGEKIEGSPLGFPYPRTKSGDIFADLIGFNKIITSSAIFRRACVEEIGPFDAGFYGCGDWHMWLKISEKWNVTYLDEPLTFYRVHESNAFRNEERMNEDSHRIREWIAENAPRLAERAAREPELKQALNHNIACLGTERMWSGDVEGGRRAYWESFRTNPRRVKSLLRLVASFLPKRAFRKLR